MREANGPAQFLNQNARATELARHSGSRRGREGPLRTRAMSAQTTSDFAGGLRPRRVARNIGQSANRVWSSAKKHCAQSVLFEQAWLLRPWRTSFQRLRRAASIS